MVNREYCDLSSYYSSHSCLFCQSLDELCSYSLYYTQTLCYMQTTLLWCSSHQKKTCSVNFLHLKMKKTDVLYLIIIIRTLEWKNTAIKSVYVIFNLQRSNLLTFQPHCDYLIVFLCRNGTVAGGTCILLRRLAYPNRLTDFVQMFGRSKSELRIVVNNVIDFIFNHITCC